MVAPLSTLDDLILHYVRALVALPSVTGDEPALEHAAPPIADLLRGLGFQVNVHPTEGAPIILAHRSGKSAQRLLFFNHYDVMPTGVWRDWFHEPFTLAEREGLLYGRGVANDKGNLAARIAAVAHILAETGELPVGITFLIEGDGYSGSPSLANLIADQANNLIADLVVGYGGGLDQARLPYLYAGVRGRLLVRLRAEGAKIPIGADMATSVPNPAWRILWAVNRIKNDSEEVTIDGFYDAVVPPSREANKLTRGLQLDEATRLKAWGMPQFLFGMSGAGLARAETFNPTCNIADLTVDTGHSPPPTIPASAEVLIDFSLVPEQRPTEVVRLLREHLNSADFHDVHLEIVKGAYPPAMNALSTPLLNTLATAVEQVYGATPQVVPLAPFSVPLHFFTAGMNVPAVAMGIQRSDSNVRVINEHVAFADLKSMARLIEYLINNVG
ncbi:M20/M25/M40 family metallo-hydrolase [Herpetosiphon geysericola]|uniref:M20/M25/M40 family metallo-hydrolase n=1 Tax=Herpetosiphon geysericola TaxID=70996 RepID=UPI0006C8FA9A|nr:M20/M25/M40 family metallo-hydrolase [Herpetosiphon geysericola]